MTTAIPPEVMIDKSPIPIVWIDTSIITYMCQLRTHPERLETIQRDRIQKLYDQIYQYGRAGKILCPLADQEGEVWINREEWMETIRNLSLGIECISMKEIQDNQRYKAMKAYARNEGSIHLSYRDVFHGDPVEELEEVLKQPYFVTVNYGIVFGANYNRRAKQAVVTQLNLQRERNVANGKTFAEELPLEFLGEITAIIQMSQNHLAGNIKNADEQFNAFAAQINLSEQLRAWQEITERENDLEGLLEFYKSNYNKKCPYVNLSCNLYAKMMTDPQPIRSGDPMDIQHISTMMPFCDLFITDKAWSAFLKRRSLDAEYNCTICYVGDGNIIDSFFDKIV